MSYKTIHSMLVALTLLAGCANINTTRPAGFAKTHPAIVLATANSFNCSGLNNLQHMRTCLSAKLPRDEGGAIVGTAFWVASNLVFTAQHVALYLEHDPEGHLVSSIDGKDHTRIHVTKWYYAAGIDVALGYVADPPPHKYLKICDDEFMGEKITHHGYPKKRGYQTSAGFNNGVAGAYLFFDTENIIGGFSGGPIMSDARQCVLGVVFGAQGDTNGVAVNAEFLKAMIEAYEAVATPQIPK